MKWDISLHTNLLHVTRRVRSLICVHVWPVPPWSDPLRWASRLNFLLATISHWSRCSLLLCAQVTSEALFLWVRMSHSSHLNQNVLFLLCSYLDISPVTVRHTCGCSCWPRTWTSGDTWGTSRAAPRCEPASGSQAAAFVGNWCHSLDTEKSRQMNTQ